jgi:hypothetical protein
MVAILGSSRGNDLCNSPPGGGDNSYLSVPSHTHGHISFNYCPCDLLPLVGSSHGIDVYTTQMAVIVTLPLLRRQTNSYWSQFARLSVCPTFSQIQTLLLEFRNHVPDRFFRLF